MDADEPRVTAEERARIEWETRPLVALLAWRREDRLDPAASSTARFYGWLVRELRARQHPRDELTPEQIADMSRRVRSLIEANRLGVRLVRSVLEGASPSEARDRWGADGSFEWRDAAVAAGAGREIWDEPCERFAELPPELPGGRYVGLTVAGDSMEPLVHAGDVVLVRVGGAVRHQTVVVARHPDDGYVLKEVGRIKRDEIELRSLNPLYPVIRIPRDPRLVLGTVVRAWHRRQPVR